MRYSVISAQSTQTIPFLQKGFKRVHEFLLVADYSINDRGKLGIFDRVLAARSYCVGDSHCRTSNQHFGQLGGVIVRQRFQLDADKRHSLGYDVDVAKLNLVLRSKLLYL